MEHIRDYTIPRRDVRESEFVGIWRDTPHDGYIRELLSTQETVHSAWVSLLEGVPDTHRSASSASACLRAAFFDTKAPSDGFYRDSLNRVCRHSVASNDSTGQYDAKLVGVLEEAAFNVMACALFETFKWAANLYKVDFESQYQANKERVNGLSMLAIEEATDVVLFKEPMLPEAARKFLLKIGDKQFLEYKQGDLQKEQLEEEEENDFLS